jgi:hypothetical protein
MPRWVICAPVTPPHSLGVSAPKAGSKDLRAGGSRWAGAATVGYRQVLKNSAKIGVITSGGALWWYPSII